ncbi:hypothetical protein PS723_05042 [Pseudomonas fluorescens]|uniref:Uncharacterized protein n=1 Tax=Pseudomonas fluorescens TaxID=294 RepID=A0A5E7EXH6_PSEFL|nr:hypothetical protein PS723_05042 [Pseudomonas fluorescens]
MNQPRTLYQKHIDSHTVCIARIVWFIDARVSEKARVP